LNNSKLLETISGISKVEWEAFGHFLKGTDGAFNSKLNQFYQLLDTYYDEHFAGLIAGGDDSLKIIIEAGINKKQLRYLVADMWTALTKFLVARCAMEDPVTGDVLLGKFFSEQFTSKAYRHYYHKLEKRREKTGDSIFFLRQYLSESVHLEEVVSKGGRGDDNNITFVSRYLDLFYISKKLQLMCEMQNLKNIVSTSSESFLEKEIIDSIGKGTYDTEPAILIYYRIFKTLTESERVSHFYSLKDLLQKNDTLFRKSERRDMYQYLMNYCIKKINTGEADWVKTLLDIYRSILENKVIYMDGFLSPWDFKNIVVIGLRSGEKEWVYNFITGKNKDINAAERSNAYNYNMGYYYFFTGDHRKAIAMISKTNFSDLYYQLDSRSILLKCFYEMGDIDGLLYFMPSFNMFLRRNRLISEYQRTIYSNLVKFTNKLVRYDGNKKRLNELLININEVKQVADINWLATKVEHAMTTS
jgi:hypothetical protein